ncbi:MAG: ATP-binding protein [Pseudomonadota bacterium]
MLARNVITAGMASKVSGATQEAIANAVLHGNLGLNPAGAEEDFDAFHRAIAARLTEPDVARRRVTVDISWTAAEVTIEIGDEGDGFEPPDADSMALTVAASGRGMTIMRSLASRIAFKDGGRRTVLGFACGS